MAKFPQPVKGKATPGSPEPVSPPGFFLPTLYTEKVDAFGHIDANQ